MPDPKCEECSHPKSEHEDDFDPMTFCRHFDPKEFYATGCECLAFIDPDDWPTAPALH